MDPNDAHKNELNKDASFANVKNNLFSSHYAKQLCPLLNRAEIKLYQCHVNLHPIALILGPILFKTVVFFISSFMDYSNRHQFSTQKKKYNHNTKFSETKNVLFANRAKTKKSSQKKLDRAYRTT